MNSEMRRKTLIAVILLCITCFFASAKDVVFLKNGSIIYGELMEVIPGQTIKLRTADDSIFGFQMDEVDHITTDENEPENAYH